MVPEGPSLEERIAATRAPERWPIMHQRWLHLLFLHWPVSPEVLRPLLPPGLAVDTFEGRAYVGLVPFTMRGIRPPLLPAVPVLSRFHEVNLRTYVHRGGREPGVWFFSLDAASRAAVIGARAWFRLAYHYARMHMEVEPGPDGGPRDIRYRAERLWPGPRPARCALRYRPCGPVFRAEPGSPEYFLAERYILYARAGDGLRQGRVAHEPYPLQPAEADDLDETLSDAARVPGAGGERLVHYSRGVSVRIFPPAGP
jgi:uncharacterized protein YqjF (DUF2071 family)